MAARRNERTADDPPRQNLGQLRLRSRRAIANLARFENQKRAAPLKVGIYPNARCLCAVACESFDGSPRPCAWATRPTRRTFGRLRCPFIVPANIMPAADRSQQRQRTYILHVRFAGERVWASQKGLHTCSQILNLRSRRQRILFHCNQTKREPARS